MHRLSALLLATGLLSSALGCYHVHGVCDCIQPPSRCLPITAPAPTAIVPSQHVTMPPAAVEGAPVAEPAELPKLPADDK